MVGQRVWGAHADVKASEDLSWKLSYEDFEDVAGREKREGNAELKYQIDESLALELGAKCSVSMDISKVWVIRLVDDAFRIGGRDALGKVEPIGW